MLKETENRLADIERVLVKASPAPWDEGLVSLFTGLCLDNVIAAVALRNNASWLISEVRRLDSLCQGLTCAAKVAFDKRNEAEKERDEWKAKAEHYFKEIACVKFAKRAMRKNRK